MLLWMFIAAALACAATSSPYAQETTPLHAYFRALPLHGSGNPPGSARAAVAASSSSVPLWDYTGQFASRDGNTYSGTMVGRSPFFHGARTTNINAILVPVTVTFQDTGTAFDPGQTDAACLPNGAVTATSLTQQSPILMPANFTMDGVNEGSTQYVDAFQRANFFAAVNPSGNSFHTLLNLTATVPASTSIAAASGGTFNSPCGHFGVMDVNAFDNIVQNSLLPALASNGVGPTNVHHYERYQWRRGVPRGPRSDRRAHHLGGV
jgi:hypothetical protein